LLLSTAKGLLSRSSEFCSPGGVQKERENAIEEYSALVCARKRALVCFPILLQPITHLFQIGFCETFNKPLGEGGRFARPAFR